MPSSNIDGGGASADQATPLPFGERERTPQESPTAARIDRYALLRELGGGGMGVVYAAYDEHLDRKVALKVLSERNTSATARSRMLREAQALARLSHTNVVGVHDVGISEGRVFMAMEFISGQTLRTWLSATPRAREAILEVFVEAGRGLAAAHAAGIVHRDFKPDNVMVDDEGRVRVFDFGLARPTGSTSEQELDFAAAAAHEALGELDVITATGTILGTPGYMSPEQHMGRPADARTDIYAFCVSLYEAFYGQRPFVGETHSALANAVIRGELSQPPRGIISPRLRRIILRGLDVDPGARWPTMEALLSAITDDPIRRRRRAALIVAGLVAFVALVIAAPIAIVGVYDRWQSERHERIAQERWQAAARQIEAVDDGERERIFNAFVSAADHRGTRALTQAWSDAGAQALARGDLEAANRAYGQAYANTDDAELTRQTQLALAEIALQRRDWPTLGVLLGELGERPAADAERIAKLKLHYAFATRRVDETPAQADDAALAALVRPLTRGRRLGTRVSSANLADTDDDGIDEIILITEDHRAVVVVDRELRLLLRHDLPPQLSRPVSIPGEPLVTTYSEGELHVHRVGDRFDELWRAPAEARAYAAVSGDVDGLPGDELYFGLAAYRRGLHVLRADAMADAGTDSDSDPDSAPDSDSDSDSASDSAPDSARLEIVDQATDRSRSDINDLLIADLDGDGRDELIAAVGPWKAYDLRIFRARGDGQLELAARAQLGNIRALALLKRPGAPPRIAALKDNAWPSPDVFPEPPHTGAPAGIYLFAYDGHELEQQGYVDPLADFATPAVRFSGHIFAGDFDSDGRDDLVVNAKVDGSDLGQLMIVLRQQEQGFGAAHLLGLRAVAVADLDDDPEPELLVEDRALGSSYWAIGIAEEPLRSPLPARSLAVPPAGVTDPNTRDGWRRAERLAAIGQGPAAAAALHTTALLTEPGPQRETAEARATNLYSRAGEDARAVAIYQSLKAVDDPILRANAARSLIRLGRYGEAQAALVNAAPELRLADRLRPADLSHLADEAKHAAITFDTALHPSWEILDPIGLRRDPRTDTLRVRAGRDASPLARLPIAWDGGPLVLSAALSVIHSEFAGTLDVSLRAASGQRIAGFWLSTVGGAGLYQHHVGCVIVHGGIGERLLHSEPIEAIEERFDHEITVTIVPSRDIMTCRMGQSNAAPVHANLPEELPPGPYTLEIASGYRSDDAETTIAVDFARIDLRGATVRQTDDADAHQGSRAAHLLANEDFAAALPLLDEAQARGDDADADRDRDRDRVRNPRIDLWRAFAAARVGDLELSRAALLAYVRSGDQAPEERTDLQRLLRLAPELTPTLREVLGDAFTRLLTAAWWQTIKHHPTDPYVVRALTEELRHFGVSPTDNRDAVRLLAGRGRAWHRIGELDRALTDLRVAEASSVEALDDAEASSVAISLARLHIDRGDRDRAIAALKRALVLSPTPELDAERLGRDPSLRALLQEIDAAGSTAEGRAQ